MKIAVISDLHLGSDDPTDSFGHDDGEFLRFSSFLESNFERIVLRGDIWETLTSRCPWLAHRALIDGSLIDGSLIDGSLIDGALIDGRRRHPEIAQRFQRPSYTYIHGNHDLIAADVDGAPEHWSLDVDGKRLPLSTATDRSA